MSNPNPLIPQGSFQAQATKGASNVRIAVATIVAIHVVFFGGLLLQGCKRDTKTGSLTNPETNTPASNLTLPPIDTGYYSNSTHLPSESSSSLFTSAPPAVVENYASNAAASVRETLAPSGMTATPQAAISESPAGPAKEYTIVRGDTFGKIAAANGVTVNALRKANPGIDPAKLRLGMKIQVPAAAPTTAVSAPSAAGGKEAAPGLPVASGGAGGSYTVKAGDTLTKVAKSHGVTVSQLRAANSLKTSGLKVGQKLKIPAPAPAGADTRRTNNPAKGVTRSTL